MFIDDFEVGNLVNPLGHSVDVGFGFERILQIVENKERIDETSVFDQDIENPVVRVLLPTIEIFRREGMPPGNKKQNYICRRLIRKILPMLTNTNP